MGDTINFLIPTHKKLEGDAVNSLLEKFNLDDVFKLPKIKIKDASIKGMDLSIGDIVEIERYSFAGKTKYYRLVIE